MIGTGLLLMFDMAKAKEQLTLSDEKARIGELEALLALARTYADGQSQSARCKHLYTAVVVAALEKGNACAKRIVAEWHTKAAEQNDVEAMMLLADMYMNDEFRFQDLEKGVYWLKKAAAAGDQEAKEKLKRFEKRAKEERAFRGKNEEDGEKTGKKVKTGVK